MTKTHDTDGAPETSAKGGDADTRDNGERVAKVLARAGLCSRREAEEWIVAGRVAVDGKVLETPAFTVGPNNRVTVDGKPLPVKERTRLWLFHKPRGLVTTNQDPEGRPTVFSVLPEDMPRVVTVGRLDINTEGLLLLTNDGGVARVLELPATGWLRRYRVRAYGAVEEATLKELEHGVSLDGVDYGPIEAAIERVQGHNTWLVLGLREGKNREVKRVLASLGLEVNRLIRISFGPFQLADLEEGEIREIRGRVLRDQLGKRLVAESGADFDAPLIHHMQGDTDEDEGRKRKVRAVGTEEAPRGRTRPPRTAMEFIGTGEKRGPARDERGAREGRGERPHRSEGFRGRPEGGEGRPQKWRSEGFRGRAEGGEGRPNKPRSEGFRGRPDGERPRSEGFRGRPETDRPRSEGGRGRPETDRPRGEGFRDRPRSGESFQTRKPRERGEEGRGFAGDRPRSEGYIGRDGYKSAGFRGRPDGERPRSEGFRDRPDGGEGRARSRAEGFRDRPEGGAKKAPARVEGFGPRGPRGMSPGGRTGPKGGGSAGPDAGPRGFGPRGDGPGRGGPKGAGPKGGGFKGGGPKGGGFKGGPGRGGPDRGGPGRGGPGRGGASRGDRG
jgi:23S rRNA pseudouridine2605 synthase